MTSEDYLNDPSIFLLPIVFIGFLILGLCFVFCCYLLRYVIVQFPKISTLPPQKGLEFPGGVGGSIRPKKYKEMYEA